MFIYVTCMHTVDDVATFQDFRIVCFIAFYEGNDHFGSYTQKCAPKVRERKKAVRKVEIIIVNYGLQCYIEDRKNDNKITIIVSYLVARCTVSH